MLLTNLPEHESFDILVSYFLNLKARLRALDLSSMRQHGVTVRMNNQPILWAAEVI